MSIISLSGRMNVGKDTVGKIWQIIDGSPHFSTQGVMQFLNKPYDSRFEIKKWADSLKDMVCILLGCTREELENQEFKNTELPEEWWYTYGKIGNKDILVPYLDMDKEFKNNSNSFIEKPTPRLLLQLLGTECCRQIIHPNIWVNALMSEYKPKDAPYNSLGDLLEDRHNGLLNNPNWVITDTRFPNELKAVKDRGGITIRVDRPRIVGIRHTLKDGTYKDEIIKEHESETSLDDATFDYYINNNGSLEELIEEVVKIYQDVKKNKLL